MQRACEGPAPAGAHRTAGPAAGSSQPARATGRTLLGLGGPWTARPLPANMAAIGAALPNASVPTPPRVERPAAAPVAKRARRSRQGSPRLYALVRVVKPTDIVTAEPAGRKLGRVFRFLVVCHAAPLQVRHRESRATSSYATLKLNEVIRAGPTRRRACAWSAL